VIAGGWKTLLIAGVVAGPLMVSGCTQSVDKLAGDISTSSVRPYAYTAKDKECLARAMFFEANRSSRDGLVAVGTVVMNRVQSGKYADTVCGVVGQKGQFASGVLSRKMNSKAVPEVHAAAEAVLKGERHPKVKNAMFFHTAGLKFPYKNMHYVLVAGGNAFYEKRGRRNVTQPAAPTATETMVAAAAPVPNARPHIETAVATADIQTVAQKGDRVVAMTAASKPRRLQGRQQPARLEVEADAAPAAEESVLSYEASPEAADAIGAMILTQDRPSFD
jgi:spore germination cell wall hydrolase CwlJ-like protein